MTEDLSPEQTRAEPGAPAPSPMGQLIRYCLIGVTGASLDAVLFWLMTRAGVYYQLANFISVTCGIVNNFFLNAFFNFKTKNRLLRRFCSFYPPLSCSRVCCIQRRRPRLSPSPQI